MTVPASIRVRLAVVVLACGGFAALPWSAAAQLVGANLSGVVTDDSGGALPGVTVTVTNRGNGFQVVFVTAADGKYRAVSLQPGAYEVVAELAGFTRQTRQLNLTVGADATLDLQLGVGVIEETVMVSGSASLVEVTRSQPSSAVIGEQIASLPVLERNFLSLAQLMPGAAPDQRPNRFSITKFGGAADQRNSFTTIIDGGDIDDVIQGNPTINLSQDAVQEFKVFRNQFDAQYGNALSAVVAVVSKSGTNQLHGTGYYFGRDDALNAKNAFARTKPEYQQGRVGGSVGGPLLRNRTFFFATYEYNDVNDVRIIALPASNPFATAENGTFPSGRTNHLFNTKLDHRFNDRHSLFVRYAFDDQFILRNSNTTSDSRQGDDFSTTHSVVGEGTSILSPRLVNSLRVHFLTQNVGTLTHSTAAGETRPSIATGPAPTWPQYFPRTKTTVSESLYYNTARHDIKLGGDYSYSSGSYESHANETGQFTFTTDLPFDANTRATWPISLVMQTPGRYSFASSQIALYAQDNWRIADRFRLNLGLRYDYDTDLRHENFYRDLLANPAYAGIENFVSDDRGNDINNLQPRVGATWDVFGNARLVGRAGYGMYVTRNRPYFQMVTQDGTLSSAVRIEDPIRLSRYPDIDAILGGQSLSEFVSTGARSLYLLSDDYVLPYQHNFTVGASWQVTRERLARRRPGSRRGPQAAGFDRSQPAGQRLRQRPQPAAGLPLHRREDDRELHRQPVRRPGDAVPHPRAGQRQRAGLLHPVAHLPERRDPLRELPGHDADAAGRGLQRPGHPSQPVDRRLDVAAVGLRPERRPAGVERRAVQRPGRLRRRWRRPDPGRPSDRAADHRRPRGRRGVAGDHRRPAPVAQPAGGGPRAAEARALRVGRPAPDQGVHDLLGAPAAAVRRGLQRLQPRELPVDAQRQHQLHLVPDPQHRRRRAPDPVRGAVRVLSGGRCQEDRR